MKKFIIALMLVANIGTARIIFWPFVTVQETNEEILGFWDSFINLIYGASGSQNHGAVKTIPFQTLLRGALGDLIVDRDTQYWDEEEMIRWECISLDDWNNDEFQPDIINLLDITFGEDNWAVEQMDNVICFYVRDRVFPQTNKPMTHDIYTTAQNLFHEILHAYDEEKDMWKNVNRLIGGIVTMKEAFGEITEKVESVPAYQPTNSRFNTITVRAVGKSSVNVNLSKGTYYIKGLTTTRNKKKKRYRKYGRRGPWITRTVYGDHSTNINIGNRYSAYIRTKNRYNKRSLWSGNSVVKIQEDGTYNVAWKGDRLNLFIISKSSRIKTYALKYSRIGTSVETVITDDEKRANKSANDAINTMVKDIKSQQKELMNQHKELNEAVKELEKNKL